MTLNHQIITRNNSILNVIEVDTSKRSNITIEHNHVYEVVTKNSGLPLISKKVDDDLIVLQDNKVVAVFEDFYKLCTTEEQDLKCVVLLPYVQQDNYLVITKITNGEGSVFDIPRFDFANVDLSGELTFYDIFYGDIASPVYNPCQLDRESKLSLYHELNNNANNREYTLSTNSSNDFFTSYPIDDDLTKNRGILDVFRWRWVAQTIDYDNLLSIHYFDGYGFNHFFTIADKENVIAVTTSDTDTETTYNTFGYTEADTIIGGGGNDRLAGNKGNDTISGRKGNDVLVGGEGDDILKGGDGDDILQGGTGNDTLTGGNGHDFFYWNNKSDDDPDIITDFSLCDVIVLDNVLTNYGENSDINSFINVIHNGTNTTIEIDKNGSVNGVDIDMSITLEGFGSPSLDAATMVDDGSILII